MKEVMYKNKARYRKELLHKICPYFQGTYKSLTGALSYSFSSGLIGTAFISNRAENYVCGKRYLLVTPDFKV